MSKPKTPIADRLGRMSEPGPNGCVNWTGSVNHRGHGRINAGNSIQYAHRVAWQIGNGPIPDGLVIDHMCRNRRCVNVEHLHVVTQKQNCENVGRSAANTSGVRGVSWVASRGKWMAQVMHNRRRYHVGMFAAVGDAEAAVIAKRNELFTNNLADRHLIEA